MAKYYNLSELLPSAFIYLWLFLGSSGLSNIATLASSSENSRLRGSRVRLRFSEQYFRVRSAPERGWGAPGQLSGAGRASASHRPDAGLLHCLQPAPPAAGTPCTPSALQPAPPAPPAACAPCSLRPLHLHPDLVAEELRLQRPHVSGSLRSRLK
ncbi:unnamed protein product [Nyctereutes procyonoides]|uniref:(raccoon dog) hypothetical protein n=1 Tax=Nyctereutes procyonoides TaxID=34880 RepID=A0A812A0V7_NYCPR|nr:unnamed protein product [Nyctereutes procyonoides]